jgi:hypothetical protein
LVADGTAHAIWLPAMTPHRTLIPLIALVATACLKLPEIEFAQVDAGTPDTEQPQTDAGSSGGTLSSVRLIKPTGTVLTNGTIDVQVELICWNRLRTSWRGTPRPSRKVPTN